MPRSYKRNPLLVHKKYKVINDKIRKINITDEDTNNAWDLFIAFDQMSTIKRIERNLTRMLNPGVRHSVSRRIVAVSDLDIVQPILNLASKRKELLRKSYVDGKFVKEQVMSCTFATLPPLNDDTWHTKEFVNEIHNSEHNVHIKNRSRARVTKLKLVYAYSTGALEATMEWAIDKYVELGKYKYWTKSN